ncbi:MAG TPA: acyltransferase [Puia sp.]|jgi:fucose 4-O-acetylase-like acetyltransferase|nr:acyltransferase [Puia sp.]
MDAAPSITPRPANPLRDWFARAFNTNVLQKSRLAWVDYLRGIAIVLVVYRHVLLGLQNSGMAIPHAYLDANIMFFSFRMPLFFILSGIFISGSLAKKSLGRIIYSKFELLLYPYLIWSVIQITIQLFASRYTNAHRTVADYLDIFYQPKNIDQFWYLPALFNSTIVYLLTKTKLKLHGWMQIILGLILYFLSQYCRKITMMSDWMEFYIFFAIGDTFSTYFFQDGFQSFLKGRLTLLCLFPIFLATQFYYLHLYNTSPGNDVNLALFLPIALFGCLTMCTLAYRLQAWNILRFLRVLGYHSLYIYVMHVIVAACVRVILTKVFHLQQPVALLFIGIVLASTIPVMIYNLFIFEKPLFFLFSLRRYPAAKQKPVTKIAPAA